MLIYEYGLHLTPRGAAIYAAHNRLDASLVPNIGKILTAFSMAVKNCKIYGLDQWAALLAHNLQTRVAAAGKREESHKTLCEPRRVVGRARLLVC